MLQDVFNFFMLLKLGSHRYVIVDLYEQVWPWHANEDEISVAPK